MLGACREHSRVGITLIPSVDLILETIVVHHITKDQEMIIIIIFKMVSISCFKLQVI